MPGMEYIRVQLRKNQWLKATGYLLHKIHFKFKHPEFLA